MPVFKPKRNASPPPYTPVRPPVVETVQQPALPSQFFQARVKLAESLTRIIDTHKQLQREKLDVEEMKKKLQTSKHYLSIGMQELRKAIEFAVEAKESENEYDIKSLLSEIRTHMLRASKAMNDSTKIHDETKVLLFNDQTQLNVQLVYELHNINAVSQVLNSMQ